MKKLVISIALMNLLVACASPAPKEETASTSDTAPQVEQGAMAGSSVAADPLNDRTGILAKRSVYFPFDVSVVQASDKPVVQAHGQYLSEHPDRSVRVEGHADERGSNEYNLALGQRRADAVKKMLVLSGASEDQVDTISYGEEKPVATGHDESSWSKNRRGDIKY